MFSCKNLPNIHEDYDPCSSAAVNFRIWKIHSSSADLQYSADPGPQANLFALYR